MPKFLPASALLMITWQISFVSWDNVCCRAATSSVWTLFSAGGGGAKEIISPELGMGASPPMSVMLGWVCSAHSRVI